MGGLGPVPVGRCLAGAALMFMLPAAGPARAPADAASRVHTIVIDQMAFGKAPANARVGDTILWVNKDMFRHTATARNKAFDVDLKPGASARVTLKQPGVLSYYCRYHPGMTGSFKVAEQGR